MAEIDYFHQSQRTLTAASDANGSIANSDELQSPSSRHRRFTRHTLPVAWHAANQVENEVAFPDPQREHDRSQLRQQLQDMQLTVSAADEVLSTRRPLQETATVDEDQTQQQQDNLDFTTFTPRAPEIDQELLPISEGWLHKKSSSGAFRNWKRRYFRLIQTELYYFKNEASNDPSGKLSLNEYARIEVPETSRTHKNKNVKHEFKISIPRGRTMELYAETEGQSNSWIESLAMVINACIQASKPPTPPPTTKAMKPKKRRPEEEAQLADDAMKHTAYGQGLYEAIRGEAAAFIIQTHDEWGNARQSGGEHFKITIENEEFHFDVNYEDNGDGTYDVTYTPTQCGEYVLSITLNGYDIYGSPFHPIVQPAPTAASHCLLSGEGAKVAVVGAANSFTITARDQFDGLRDAGGDSFEVVLHGPGKVLSIVDKDDGTYDVSYEVTIDEGMRSGGVLPTVEIEVNLKNEKFTYPRPVSGSPLRPELRLQHVPPLSAAMKLHTSEGLPVSTPQSSTDKRAIDTQVMTSEQTSQPINLTASMQATTLRAPELGTPHPVYSAGHAHMVNDRKVNASTTAHRFQVHAQQDGLDILRMRQEAEEAFARAQAMTAQLVEREREVNARMNELRAFEQQLIREQSALEAEKSAVRAKWEELQALQAQLQPQQQLVTSSQNRDASQSLANSHTQPSYSEQPIARSVATSPSASHQHATTTANRTSPTPSHNSLSAPQNFETPSGARLDMHDLDESIAVDDALDVTPPELYEPEVVALFDQYKRQLWSVYQYFAGEDGIDIHSFIRLCKDYDITPTFLPKRELKKIFTEAALAHAPPHDQQEPLLLSNPAFIDALGRIALVALSRPAFVHLYPTAHGKVSVVLEMWGLADLRRLDQIRERYEQKKR